MLRAHFQLQKKPLKVQYPSLAYPLKMAQPDCLALVPVSLDVMDAIEASLYG